jgi:hypothetical protein
LVVCDNIALAIRLYEYQKLGKAAPHCPTLNKPFSGCILLNDPRVQQAVTEYQEIISLSTIN